MILSPSRTMHLLSPPLIIGKTKIGDRLLGDQQLSRLKESEDLDILGVTYDCKMTFEKHHRSVSRSSSFSKT